MMWKEIKDKIEELGVKDDTLVFYTDYSFGGKGEEFDSDFSLTPDKELLIRNPGGCDCGLE